MIWLIVGVLVLGMGIVAYFLLRDSSEPTPSETPTISATPVPTATPFGFRQIFNVQGALSGNLDEAIGNQALGVDEVRTFTVDSLGIGMPTDLTNTLDQSEPTYVILFGKPNGSKGRGFARKISDPARAITALATWESTMAQDVASFLKIDPKRATSRTFASNLYQGVTVKYRNFPDAFNSVDYAIVNLPDDSSYLVVTNSRDHMFAVIDRAVGVVLGK